MLTEVRSDPEAASKAELREHKTEVKANIDQHESKVLHATSDLRKDTEIMIRDVIIKITAVVISVAGLLFAAIKLF